MAIKDPNKKAPRKRMRPIEDFGAPGIPINRSHPFYFGFLATSGGLLALVMLRSLAAASQILVLIIIALFLAIGLNPAVERLRHRGMSRYGAVGIIFAAVMVFVGLFAWLVIPPVVSQGTQLLENGPTILADLKHNATIASLNDQYGIVDTLQKKFASISSNGTLLFSAFGGVIGVGRSVLSGTFAAITVLILTLYFLSSLPTIIHLGLRLVPTTRRDRVTRLTNGVIDRIGTYIGSQITVALISGTFILFLAIILRLPSPIALAMLVFVCDLAIPLIGHTIGISIITIIALTHSILVAIIAFVAYVVYVQIENYVITPKIMRRSLAIPGVVTIIAALTGAALLGLVGALLAVPLAASFILILDEVLIPRAENS